LSVIARSFRFGQCNNHDRPSCSGRDKTSAERPHRPESAHRNLTAGTTTALTQTAAIHGLGGVGKTQLAIEYAYRFKDDYDVGWWLRAEDPALLAGDCTTLARVLDLPEKDAREQAIVIAAVRRWLEGHGRWLLVYDNAEDPKVVREALPRAPTGHVLITSRNPAWGGIAQALPLDRWPREESVRFLRERSGKVDDRAADRRLFLPSSIRTSRRRSCLLMLKRFASSPDIGTRVRASRDASMIARAPRAASMLPASAKPLRKWCATRTATSVSIAMRTRMRSIFPLSYNGGSVRRLIDQPTCKHPTEMEATTERSDARLAMGATAELR
jgi:hypothetical protein